MWILSYNLAHEDINEFEEDVSVNEQISYTKGDAVLVDFDNEAPIFAVVQTFREENKTLDVQLCKTIGFVDDLFAYEVEITFDYTSIQQGNLLDPYPFTLWRNFPKPAEIQKTFINMKYMIQEDK